MNTFRSAVLSKYTLSPKTVKWLGDWIDQDVDYDVWENLRAAPAGAADDLEPYRLESAATLYRGFFFPSSDDFLEASNRLLDHVPEMGETFEYEEPKSISAWSKDLKMAKGFAHNGEYGFVVEAHFKPGETLVDTDRLPPELCDKFRRGCSEHEVIALPFERRKVKVVYLQDEYAKRKAG